MSKGKQKDSIDKEDIKAIRRSFEVLDCDQNGRISELELMKGIQVLGYNPSLKEARSMIQEIDTNGNGYIEYSEYEELTKRKLKSNDQEEDLLRDAFKKFDKNGDGYVSAKELRRALCGSGEDKLTNEDVNELLKEVDIDGDGKICYEEFVKAFC